jgi:hypothetical protein
MADTAQAGAHSPRWLIVVVAIACALMLAYIANAWLNVPVGGYERVPGTLSGNCVPRGKQSNNYHCTATLADGSTQTFIAQRSLVGGTRVDFNRRERRYFGNHYELARVAP